MTEPLYIPDFTERLQRAIDLARMTPTQIRDAVRELGIEVGEKSIYKLLGGDVKNPSPALLAGLAKVLGTDVRWFCEPDADGQLYAALSAHWTSRSR